jgi:hypothetical protein
LGKVYESSEPVRQEGFCRQAVAVDPRFALGFECLASMAYNRGDRQDAIANQKRAVALLPPNDPDQFFSYNIYLESDPAQYKAATEEMLKRFPDSPESAQALYWYAVNQPTGTKRISGFFNCEKPLKSSVGQTKGQATTS